MQISCQQPIATAHAIQHHEPLETTMETESHSHVGCVDHHANSIVYLNHKAIVVMRKGRYSEAARLLQMALDRIDPESEKMEDYDDDEEYGNYDINDDDEDDEFLNFVLEAVPLTPPPSVRWQEEVKPFLLLDRALAVLPLAPSTTRLHSQSSPSPTALLEDRDILSSPERCHFLACVLLYNKALCSHLQGLEGGRSADFEDSLMNYNMAVGIMSDFFTSNPSKLLLELALLNNKGHVHYDLVDLEETQRCLDRMDTLLADYRYGAQSPVPSALIHFAQNLIHNRRQMTTRLPPVA
ncbi:hypothetical protein ACA910_020069 [Epithemia clementina (nom. ined.)]